MLWPTGSFTSHIARFAEVTCFQGSRYHSVVQGETPKNPIPPAICHSWFTAFVVRVRPK